jgi:hypothetical protein
VLNGKENAIGPHFWCCKEEDIYCNFLREEEKHTRSKLKPLIYILFYSENVTCSATVK